MSKYKISFFLEDGEEVIEETIDLIDDWGYSEEEAKELIKSEKRQRELYEEWLNENTFGGYVAYEEEE